VFRSSKRIQKAKSSWSKRKVRGAPSPSAINTPLGLGLFSSRAR
jgi:hypothetical protein